MISLVGAAKRWAEEIWARGYGEADGYFCLGHVMDSTLGSMLAGEMTPQQCVLCGAEDEVVTSFEGLVSIVQDTMKFFFQPADELPWDSEEGVYAGPVFDTREALEEFMDGSFEGEVADYALEMLHEAFGGDTQWTPWGSPADTEDLAIEWSRFSDYVRFESRFIIFNEHDGSVASNFLRRLDDYLRDEAGLVRSLPQGSQFFRGRLCEDPRKIEPSASQLGPAPRGRASANRMSPQGISLFYGSADMETAVAEIAGHGVAPFATVGRFETTRPLRILDLTLRPRLPSPFDESQRREYRMLSFLSSFVRAITTPVIPDGRQHVEYVPTQVVTEYFRRAIKITLDGVALPSAQTHRPTYVLFLGPGDVADSTDEPREPSLAAQLLGVDDPAPTLVLDPTTVETYRVIRTYAAQKDQHPIRSHGPPL